MTTDQIILEKLKKERETSTRLREKSNDPETVAYYAGCVNALSFMIDWTEKELGEK